MQCGHDLIGVRFAVKHTTHEPTRRHHALIRCMESASELADSIMDVIIPIACIHQHSHPITPIAAVFLACAQRMYDIGASDYPRIHKRQERIACIPDGVHRIGHHSLASTAVIVIIPPECLCLGFPNHGQHEFGCCYRLPVTIGGRGVGHGMPVHIADRIRKRFERLAAVNACMQTDKRLRHSGRYERRERSVQIIHRNGVDGLPWILVAKDMQCIHRSDIRVIPQSTHRYARKPRTVSSTEPFRGFPLILFADIAQPALEHVKGIIRVIENRHACNDSMDAF